MTVYLSIISLFKSEDHVNSSASKIFFFEAEVAGTNLEKVQAILRNVFFFHIFIHKLFHGLHSPFVVTLVFFHKALILQNLLVKKAFFGGIFLKGFWNLVKAITNADHNKILLSKLETFVQVHDIVVLDNACESRLEQINIFVVHRNASCDLR